MKKVIVAVAMMSVGILFAGTIEWTGAGGDGLWTNTLNWANSVRPSWGDEILFDKPGSTYVSIEGNDLWIRFITVKQGDVYIGSPVPKYFYFHGSDPSITNVIDVAAGSTLVISNTVGSYSGAGANLRKTGGGVFSMPNRLENGQTYTSALQDQFWNFEIAEGMVSNRYIEGTSYGTYLYVVSNVVIRSGATLYHAGYNALRNSAVYTVDKGGKLILHMSGSTNVIAGLQGEGTVEATSYGTLKQTLLNGPYTFSGTVSESGENLVSLAFENTYNMPDEQFKFIIGASNTVANTSVTGSKVLGFKPGVGEFWIKNLYPIADETITLEDTEGNPISLIAKVTADYFSKFRVAGSGSYFADSFQTFTGNQLGLTGSLGATSNGAIDLGNGTEAGDVDLSSVAAFLVDKSYLNFNNYNDLEVTTPITGKKTVNAYGPGNLTLDNLHLGPSAETLVSRTTMTLTGGEVSFNYHGFTSQKGGDFVIQGGSYYVKPTSNTFGNATALLTPNGLRLNTDGNAGSKLRVEGGNVWLQVDDPGGFEAFELAGGETTLTGSYNPHPNATAENSSIVRFDGGRVVCSCKANYYNMYPFHADSAKNGRLTFAVEEGGAIFDTRYALGYGQTVHLVVPLASGVTEGKDGGFSRYGAGLFFYETPFTITGPCRIFDGWNQVSATDVIAKGTEDYFGSGDFVLGNTQLSLTTGSDASAERAALHLGSAAGATFVYTNAATISGERACGWDVTLGPLTRGGKGSVLFLNDSTLGGATPSRYLVKDGVATNTQGVVLEPVVIADNNSGMFMTTYDDARGFLKLTNVVTSVAMMAADKVFRLMGGTTPTVAANTEKYVFGIDGDRYAGLGIQEGGTLHVGDGVHPAIVCESYAGWYAGTGTLDFGTSEGVIIGSNKTLEAPSTMAFRITGQNGVSFAGSVVSDHAAIKLTANNTYTGGTRINGMRVDVGSAGCFGEGDVELGGGTLNGGRIRFVEPVTLVNNFRISGDGRKETKYTDETGVGAISFETNGVVSGTIEIVGEAGIVARAGARGTIAGKVSGGKLNIRKGDGVVVLTHANDYQGGTVIEYTTLAVTAQDAVGTGDITLDAGVLRFENTTPLTFTNGVTGVGEIVLAGTAPVTFANAIFADLAFRTLGPGTHVSFDSGLLASASALVPWFSGDTDLGGCTVTVAGVTGSGRVSNGALTVTGEISPGGIGTAATLTFEEGVLIPEGATYVCDILADGEDELVIGGAIDLSAMNFREVAPAGLEPGRRVVLTARTSVSGRFELTTIPHRLHDVRYEAKAVLLSIRGGTVVIIR